VTGRQAGVRDSGGGRHGRRQRWDAGIVKIKGGERVCK